MTGLVRRLCPRLGGMLVWLIALALLLAAPQPAAAQSRDDALVIPAGTTAAGSVSTVERDIVVAGSVPGDVTSWSGDIVISGVVAGDVVSYVGRVQILSGGSVGGHVMAPGGIDRESGGAVAGQALGGPQGSRALASLLDVLSPGPTQSGPSAEAFGRPLFGALLGLFLLVFTLLLSALWPHRTHHTTLTLRVLPGRALVVGLLTTLLLAALAPLLGVLLTATLIGLPLLVLLLLVVQAPYLYGLAALTQVLGHRPEASAAGFSPAVAAAALAVAVLVGVVAALQPLAGLALLYLIASPGLGAAILSRGGMALPLAAR
ncbi:MAG TPA: polymer-forming cytoskeletal protein [Roseiflexaceae bacterium]|nr:polymer-forming cytoskeletal protein [Roseiflexaceae bacterium]